MEVFSRLSTQGRSDPVRRRGTSQETQADGGGQESLDTAEHESNEQEQNVAQQQQEMSANGLDMSQQIAEAIQPVMDDLQNQITQTVQQQLGGGGSDGAGAGMSLDGLGGLGETLKSTFDTAIERLQPFFQWLLEKVQQLISWIVGLFMGGSDDESEQSESEGEPA